MIKSSNKIVLKNEKGKILEVPAESFDIEKYINSTIKDYKYILEIDGNEVSFLNENSRIEFLKTINNCFISDETVSFSTSNIPTIILESEPETLANFHEGLTAVKKNDKFGFVDRNGNLVIPFVYEKACDFHEGLVAVKKDDKWGFINKNGEIVIPLEYDFVCDFHEGLAMVSKNNKWGFINKDGEIVIPLEYNFAYEFAEGLAPVKIKDKWGFIDKTGKIIIPIEYKNVRNFYQGFSQVIKDDKMYYIDKNNQKLNFKIMINDVNDIFNIPNNSNVIETKTSYALDFQEDKIIFESIEEREKFINSLDNTFNLDYEPKIMTKKRNR